MKRALHRAALLAVVCACATPAAPPEAARERPPRIVITSKLDERKMPVDDLERVSMSQGRFVVWVLWIEEPHGPHFHECEFTDGAGRVEKAPGKMTEHRGSKRISAGYRFDPMSSPGTWTIRLYLDHRLRAERSLEVEP